MKSKSNKKMFTVIITLMVIVTVLLGVLAVNVLQLKNFADRGSTEKTTLGNSGVEI